ncbi:MAG: aminoacetone oxidase family FAD-binding enzyme, partial [Bacteroidota bacterium]|nr:aminoacetone oxidase family FAD-binding enzyme [Bacteroidota bacterium]
MNNKDVIIIGGGASGLMCANVLMDRGKSVLILEKKHQLGLKLRITGKGRCNITNSKPKEEYLKHTNDSTFFCHAFDNFDNKALCNFFENRGLSLVEERGGRIFPKGAKALDVFLNLIKPLEKSPLIEIEKDCMVERLIVKNNRVVGVNTSDGDFFANQIVIACGGMTYPSTGSEGDGYVLAEQVGHKIVTPIPTLVGLRTKEGYQRELQDFLIKNCQVNIFDRHHKLVESMFGDVILDEYGVSGPVILTLSRLIAEDLDSGEKFYINIDLKPKVDKQTLLQEIRQTFAERRTQEVASVLRKWFAQPFIKDVLYICGLNGKTMAKNLKEEDFKVILWYMKERKDKIIGDMGWKEAIITKGGVSLEEINSKTMQSKKIKGLSFCGEVMNLDADTGGY